MSLASKTYQTLSNATAVTALTSARIYPEHRFQGTGLPAVVYTRPPGGERVNHLGGYSGKENALVEVSIFATAVDARRATADAVITAMTGSTRFTCILPDAPYDDYDDETQTYERTLQFSVWHTTT